MQLSVKRTNFAASPPTLRVIISSPARENASRFAYQDSSPYHGGAWSQYQLIAKLLPFTSHDAKASSGGKFSGSWSPTSGVVHDLSDGQMYALIGDPKRVDQDEFIRPDTTLEVLGKLKPAFRTDGKGSVTAGNASGLNDGAAALLVASEAGVKAQKFTPIARVVSVAAAGVEPRLMGMGPVPSSQLALKRAGLSTRDIDVVELNEAFAAQVVACLRELGITDDDPRVNINGGAIALGHPLGMSGARLVLTAALQLQREKKRYALVTMCIGVGQGMAMVLERA